MQEPNQANAPLIEMLDEATRLPDVDQTTDYIKTELCHLIRAGAISLSPEHEQAMPDRYARRLLHRSEALNYSVVVMTWGPEQATSIHDHAGMWCVEGVCMGEIDVDQFELVDKKNDRYRFEKRGSYTAGVASAGCLIPPYEYHRIANRDQEQVAVTVHIYGGDMTSCNAFEKVGDGWYEPQERTLSFD